MQLKEDKNNKSAAHIFLVISLPFFIECLFRQYPNASISDVPARARRDAVVLRRH